MNDAADAPDAASAADELADAGAVADVEGDAGATGLALSGARIRDYAIKPFVLLFVLNAVDEFDRSVLAVALVPIQETFGVSDAIVGLLPLAFVFIAGVVGVPAGYLADRWIRTRIITIGAVIWATAGLLAAGARSFVQLFLTRALLGFGQGTVAPTHLSLLSDYYPAGVRGRVLGYHRAANPFGQILGALLGGAIIASYGWRWAFVAAAIPGLLLGLYALTMREPRRGEADLDEFQTENPVLAEFLKEPEDKLGMRQSLGTIWHIPTVRSLVIANATIGFALIGVLFWLPGFFERRFDYETLPAAAVLAGIALASFTGTLLGSPWTDRNLHKGWKHLAGLATIAIATVAVGWSLAFAIGIDYIAIPLLIGTAATASFGLPALIVIVAAASPPRVRSQSFAIFGLALSVTGAAIAPVVVGLLSGLFSSLGMDEGSALQWAMLSAAAPVTALGVAFIARARHTCTDDINKTLADFFAEMTQSAPDS